MHPYSIAHKTALIIKIEGDFALGKIPSLDRIFEDIKANDCNVLAFDMSDVICADLSALAFLLKAEIKSRIADNRMFVIDVSDDIMEMLKFTTIDTMLTLCTKDEFENIHTS